MLPKSPLGQAFGYTLSNWDALTVFLDEGMLLADNNSCERAMRPVSVSRKNWLFAGSERGGHAAAVAFSLIESALCRTRHRADHADRRTMPTGFASPRIHRSLRVIGSA